MKKNKFLSILFLSTIIFSQTASSLHPSASINPILSIIHQAAKSFDCFMTDHPYAFYSLCGLILATLCVYQNCSWEKKWKEKSQSGARDLQLEIMKIKQKSKEKEEEGRKKFELITNNLMRIIGLKQNRLDVVEKQKLEQDKKVAEIELAEFTRQRLEKARNIAEEARRVEQEQLREEENKKFERDRLEEKKLREEARERLKEEKKVLDTAVSEATRSLESQILDINSNITHQKSMPQETQNSSEMKKNALSILSCMQRKKRLIENQHKDHLRIRNQNISLHENKVWIKSRDGKSPYFLSITDLPACTLQFDLLYGRIHNFLEYYSPEKPLIIDCSLEEIEELIRINRFLKSSHVECTRQLDTYNQEHLHQITKKYNIQDLYIFFLKNYFSFNFPRDLQGTYPDFFVSQSVKEKVCQEILSFLMPVSQTKLTSTSEYDIEKIGGYLIDVEKKKRFIDNDRYYLQQENNDFVLFNAKAKTPLRRFKNVKRWSLCANQSSMFAYRTDEELYYVYSIKLDRLIDLNAIIATEQKTKNICSIALSTDEKYIAITNQDWENIKLITIEDDTISYINLHHSHVQYIEFNPHTTQLASLNEDNIELWDLTEIKVNSNPISSRTIPLGALGIPMENRSLMLLRFEDKGKYLYLATYIKDSQKDMNTIISIIHIDTLSFKTLPPIPDIYDIGNLINKTGYIICSTLTENQSLSGKYAVEIYTQAGDKLCSFPSSTSNIKISPSGNRIAWLSPNAPTSFSKQHLISLDIISLINGCGELSSRDLKYREYTYNYSLSYIGDDGSYILRNKNDQNNICIYDKNDFCSMLLSPHKKEEELSNGYSNPHFYSLNYDKKKHCIQCTIDDYSERLGSLKKYSYKTKFYLPPQTILNQTIRCIKELTLPQYLFLEKAIQCKKMHYPLAIQKDSQDEKIFDSFGDSKKLLTHLFQEA